MKTQAECLIRQVSNSLVYSPKTDVDIEKFSSALLWRATSCIDQECLGVESTFVFHDGSIIRQGDTKFWCDTLVDSSTLGVNKRMFNTPNALKAIASEFEVRAIVDEGGYAFERGDMHLRVATSKHYVVDYMKVKAVDAILSIKIDDEIMMPLSTFTALDMRDAVMVGILNYSYFAEIASAKMD